MSEIISAGDAELQRQKKRREERYMDAAVIDSLGDWLNKWCGACVWRSPQSPYSMMLSTYDHIWITVSNGEITVNKHWTIDDAANGVTYPCLFVANLADPDSIMKFLEFIDKEMFLHENWIEAMDELSL